MCWAQSEALLDVCVVDTNAWSYLHQPYKQYLPQLKMRIRNTLILQKHYKLPSMPFVLSVDGVVCREANSMLKQVAEALSIRWSK